MPGPLHKRVYRRGRISRRNTDPRFSRGWVRAERQQLEPVALQSPLGRRRENSSRDSALRRKIIFVTCMEFVLAILVPHEAQVKMPFVIVQMGRTVKDRQCYAELQIQLCVIL